MPYDFNNELATVKKKNDVPEQITKDELAWRVKELKRCRDDIIYFANHYFRIISPEVNNGRGGLGIIKLFPKQEELLKFIQKNNRCVVLSARQGGKSTSYNIFCLWKLCFFETTAIVLLAQEAKTAISLLGRLRLAYEYLPTFLKPSIITYNKGSIEFSNHSRIVALATASQGARGTSANVLICDEIGFVPDNISNEFFSSTYPTISRDPNSKVIFVSTPNGSSDKNLFYHTWKIAGESDPSDVNAWQRFRMDWWDVPGRDEQWKENQIKAIGIERFNQEFGNEFVGSGAVRLFSAPVLETLRQNRKKDPEVEIEMASLAGEHSWQIHVWERPKPGHVYVGAADVAEGIGGDSSVLLVFDITDMSNIRLALSFANSHISISEFASLSARMLNCYGCPLFLAEDNGVGAGYLSILSEHYKYIDILSFDGMSPGIHSTAKNKMNACLWAKDFMNIYKLVLADDALLSQLEVFSRTSSKSAPSYAAIKGEHDDYTLALIWALYLLKKDVLQKSNRYATLDSQRTSLGVEVVTRIVDSESMQPHVVAQFMSDKLKEELMSGNAKELNVPWWNSEDNIIIQSNREVVAPPPFVIVGGPNDYSDFGFDDEPEFGTW